MGLPKLWAKDSTGTKGFTFSHVKTIYYNWATKKLLKTKLDEMDALIDAKIAKAMMTSQNVNDANKIPTASLTYAMNQKITQNTGSISQLNSDLDNAKADIDSMRPVTSQIVTTVSDGTDYNTLQQTGWYSVYSSVNAPGTGRFLVRVDSAGIGSSWYIVQTAYSIYGAIEPIKTRNIHQTDDGFGFTPWQ